MTAPAEGDPEARRPVRIAFSIQPQHADYPAIRRVVAQAEDAGADVVTSWDHFFPLFGDPDGKHLPPDPNPAVIMHASPLATPHPYP